MKIHAGNIILWGFGAMILFMSWLVFKCTQNPSVMVAKDYYEEELKYQDVIDAKDNAMMYSDSITMNKTSTEVVFQIPQSLNTTLQDASLKVYNKSDDKKDQTIALPKREDGLYTLNTATWGNTSYKLKLSFKSEKKSYYKEFDY